MEMLFKRNRPCDSKASYEVARRLHFLTK